MRTISVQDGEDTSRKPRKATTVGQGPDQAPSHVSVAVAQLVRAINDLTSFILRCMSCDHGKEHWSITQRGQSSRAYCLLCNYASVKRRRQKVKATLVNEAGGACEICSYARCLRSLEFHHRDPTLKVFTLSAQTSISLDRARVEAAKCALLCANCHGEIEAGLSKLPDVSPHSDKV